MTADLHSAVDVQPDEVSDYYGLPCAHFGQGFVSSDVERDPVPDVYVSGHGGGEVDLHDLRLKLDVAELYAQRILAAVAWQRRQQAEQRAADLNAVARGDAATHTWGTKDNEPNGTIQCAQCRTRVYSDEYLTAGAVPVCGDRCPLSWHAIASNLTGTPGAAACFHCKTVFPATAPELVGGAR